MQPAECHQGNFIDGFTYKMSVEMLSMSSSTFWFPSGAKTLWVVLPPIGMQQQHPRSICAAQKGSCLTTVCIAVGGRASHDCAWRETKVECLALAVAFSSTLHYAELSLPR